MLFSKDAWLAVIAAFMLMNCWGGLKQARALLQLAKLPRRYTAHMPNGQRSIRIFRFRGIDVFLHWSWFLVAVYEIQSRALSTPEHST
jgi:hypothetical protein